MTRRGLRAWLVSDPLSVRWRHQTTQANGQLAVGCYLFDSASGHLLHSADTGMRVMDAAWLHNGAQLALCGMSGQGRKTKEGKYPEFGHIKLYDFQRKA